MTAPSHWLDARYAECGTEIGVGDRAVFDPRDRKLYCSDVDRGVEIAGDDPGRRG